MGGGGPVAHSRVHPWHQTIATNRCQRVRFAAGKRAYHLSLHRRRFRVEDIAMESHIARRCGGKAGPTTGEADSHSSAKVRFRRPTSANRAEAFRWCGQKWQADRSEEHTSELQSPYVI